MAIYLSCYNLAGINWQAKIHTNMTSNKISNRSNTLGLGAD